MIVVNTIFRFLQFFFNMCQSRYLLEIIVINCRKELDLNNLEEIVRQNVNRKMNRVTNSNLTIKRPFSGLQH